VKQKEQLFAISGFKRKQPSKYWLIDSGCTNHMTYDRNLFKKLNKSTVSKVRIADGKLIAVEGSGMITIKSHFGLELISNVLYVPELNQNLLSVSQLLEKDYKVLFEHKICVIKNQNNKEVIRAHMKAKKFVLDLMKNNDIIDEDENKIGGELREGHYDACVLKNFHVKGKNENVGEKLPTIFTKVKSHISAIKMRCYHGVEFADAWRNSRKI
jgi:hypothetical protein